MHSCAMHPRPQPEWLPSDQQNNAQVPLVARLHDSNSMHQEEGVDSLSQEYATRLKATDDEHRQQHPS